MSQKKVLIVAGAVLAVFIVISVIVQHILSHHTITFNFKRDNIKIGVRQQLDNDKYSNVGSLSQSGSLSLVDGDYIIDVESTAPQRPLNKEVIKFSVNGADTTVDVYPQLSSTYLNSILENNRRSIHKIINSKYNLTNYTLSKERILGDGDWYAALFIQNPIDRENGDEYFIIARRSGNNWSIVTAPKLVITSREYPDIPQDILDQINKLYYI